MPTKKDLEASINHKRQVDRAQAERLENMFEELRDCNISRLSEIKSSYKGK